MRRAWWDSSINPWVSATIAVGWAVLSAVSFASDSVLFGIAWAVLAVAWTLLAVAAVLRRRRDAQRARLSDDADPA
ncbi:hypothetical protein C5E06_09905 [Pseudoclavibacter sp. RFBI5]|uniref:hypothetical protein n=1 Tax=Pseudoclavibacter sp. RFBI5 TaxID=2080578 RepID=UPI000CE84007|nr:hypothetical protein [Pseudoclavibacter sp. RFBI5]PPG02755.1 hypothetical protein C5E06_09905 [Pseudoclavibacter sp. RFBI5]